MKPTYYQVNHNVPLPEPHLGRNRGPVMLAMSMLRKGDSFLVPLGKEEAIYSAARRLGFKIATRKVEDGRRVWRIR